MEIHIKGIDHDSFSIVLIVFIIAFTVCFLAVNHYNTNIRVEKEKIEVDSSYSNQTNSTGEL